MSELQIYDRGSLFFEHILQAECQTFSVDNDPQLSEINTMKGFAGMSPGPKKVKIDVSSAIPRPGVEYDALQAMEDVAIVEFVCFLGGKKLKSKGFITNVKISSGADKAAEYSFSYIGTALKQTKL